MNYWLLAILVVVSYFIGNINFGKIISKMHNVDLSKKGSGNLGATNMYRNLGPKLGYLTLLLDALKGISTSVAGYFVFGGSADNFISSILGMHTCPTEALIGLYACGLSAVVGHIFPVIYKFKGGKGISTCIGVFLVAQPVVTLVAFVLCFVIVWFVKYVSLASLLLITVSVVWQNIFLSEPNLAVSLLTFAIFALTWYAHRANIGRLLNGKENETNIRAKLKRDQKRQQKQEIRLDQKQEKMLQKDEKRVQKKEKKAVIKSEKKCKRTEKYNKRLHKMLNRKSHKRKSK